MSYLGTLYRLLYIIRDGSLGSKFCAKGELHSGEHAWVCCT